MAIASLVLGIVSCVIGDLCWWMMIGWLGIICGVVGIILGALARKQQPSGLATAGLVLSILGTISSGIVYIACVACAASAGVSGIIF